MIKAFQHTEISFKNGEKIDLKDFFYLHYPGYASFAGKFIADKSVCEDIVQEIFISFWEKRSSFQSLVALKAFFFTSIRNACLDHLKHEKVEQKYYEFQKYGNEDTGSFLDEIIKIEAYKQVYQEINKLPEMEKKVLLLALQEKSNDEIATILNIAINTVRTHKARAYKVLRKNLGDLFLFFISFKNIF